MEKPEEFDQSLAFCTRKVKSYRPQYSHLRNGDSEVTHNSELVCESETTERFGVAHRGSSTQATEINPGSVNGLPV